MHPLRWSTSDTSAVLAAIRFICTTKETAPLLPLQREFLEGLREHIFHQPDIAIDALPAMPPDEFVRHISDTEHQTRALEYLTLAPYIKQDISEAQADIVRDYFTASHAGSESMTFLTRVAHHHILVGQLCLARKLLPQLLPGGPVTQIARAARMLRESRGNPAIAAPFIALGELPEGTLGSAFYRFHRNRGFALPGEPGCIPEEFSALHDLTHILSGYNTDARGEILAQAFAGGAMERHSMLVAVTGLLSYHNGIVFDAGGRFELQQGNLEPRAFAAAFARGMRSVSVMSGWDYKKDWALPVDAVRARFNITDAANVWDDPPPDQVIAAPTSRVH